MKINFLYLLYCCAALGLYMPASAQKGPQILYNPAPGLLNGLTRCHFFDQRFYADQYNYRNITFLDWDRNGLKDAFFGKTNGTITYYRNVGTPTEPCFEWVTDNFGNITIAEGSIAPFFKDFNNDSKFDLITGCGVTGSAGGWVSLYINNGTIEKPSFVLQTQKIANFDASDNSVPFAYDIDGDGDYDVFMGEGYGRRYFFQNTGSAYEPRFDSTVVLFGQVPWQSTVQIANISNDGKPEMVLTDAYGSMTLHDYKGKPTNWAAATDNPFKGIFLCFNNSGCLSRAVLVDINNDDLPDVFAMPYLDKGRAFQFFLNLGTATVPKYNFQQALDFSVRATGFPASFTDLDQDGFTEMYVARMDGKVEAYENQSMTAVANWQLVDGDFLKLPGANPKNLAFGRLNGDEYVDIAVGSLSDKTILIYLNDGKGNFILTPAPSLGNLPNLSKAVVEITDFYQDNTPDLLICTGSTIKHLICKDKSGIFWEVANTSPAGLNMTAIKVTCADLDGDGKEDILTGRYETSPLLFLQNTGELAAPVFTAHYNKYLTNLSGQYPSLTRFQGYCGPVLFLDGQFYKFGGIKPDIPTTSLEWCSNMPVSFQAEPSKGGYWGTPATAQGAIPLNTPAGTYPLPYYYPDGFGCYALSDTVWLYLKNAPAAKIQKINQTLFKTDTINICRSFGQQQLSFEESGGYFTVQNGGYIDQNGKFNAANWPLGITRVIYRINRNGCESSDTIWFRVQNCTVSAKDLKEETFPILATPNPFCDEVAVSLHQKTDENLLIVVCDLSGRVVYNAALKTTQQDQVTRWVWDGTNESGHPVPPGYYRIMVYASLTGLWKSIPVIKAD